MLLTIFPKFFWLALGLGLIFRFIGDEYSLISNIILNYLLIFVSFKVGIVIHEIGHLVFAKIGGGQPRRLVLGNGHELARFKCCDIKVVVNFPFNSGFAFATFPNQNLLKLKHLLYISGGFLFNLLFACGVYFILGFNLESIHGEHGVDFGSMFIISNGFLIIVALIPFSVTYMGINMSNDGLSILRLPFKHREKLSKELNTSELLDAYDYYEAKEYDKAIEIYERHLKDREILIYVKLNLSVMYLKKGEYSKALAILLETTDSLDDKDNKRYKALVNNNIAWLYLLLDDLDKADFYSEKAYSQVPREKIFRGTRGSVLIDKGEVEKGIDMLANLVDFRYTNNQTLSAAMYLVLGFSLNGNSDEQNKHFSFVESNIDKMDVDEIKIWETIKLKISEKSAIDQQ